MKERNKFDISLGNLVVLQQIPSMMQDEEYRVELRRLVTRFDHHMKAKFEKSQKNPTHKNSCGKEIEENGKVIINCGDDLGGENGEFAQCKECREKDFGGLPEQ